ncbi:hypothetical protein ACIBVL_19685 [Streptomyces sp. NPDC049687]|uniref:hypothetical protein n=1 Tax=Streptomyces sp. NPDC049687 TaxID=3365596 RepID=UPI00378CF491
MRYANVTKGYGVKYWEIGNEVYGNGHYGATWETDHHASLSPATYANYVVQYASAMKAVDPSIKIGSVLTTPGSWPDGIVGSGDSMDWNHTVLSIAGSKIDFVIVHHYPYSTSQADLLGKPQAEIPGMAGALRSLINQYAGSTAPNVGIAVTEGNADAYKVTTVEGATDYDDGGVLSRRFLRAAAEHAVRAVLRHPDDHQAGVAGGQPGPGRQFDLAHLRARGPTGER